MKRSVIAFFVLLAAVFGASAQSTQSASAESSQNAQNAPVNLKKGEKITRGESISKSSKKISVEKAFAEPDKYFGPTYVVDGVIVRSCKKMGCWMEMADKEGGKSVRVTFGSHAFFIPLNSAGMKVKAEGTFVKKVLSKEHVDHLINDDGAKFDQRNPDGTVTEVSFNATGVVLTKTE